jgi:hypothetical protein
MEANWTYYKLLGGSDFDLVRGLFRRQIGGRAERWDAEATAWIPISTWFLTDRISAGAIDLDAISEIEARQLMEDTALLRPAQSLTAD